MHGGRGGDVQIDEGEQRRPGRRRRHGPGAALAGRRAGRIRRCQVCLLGRRGRTTDSPRRVLRRGTRAEGGHRGQLGRGEEHHR